MRGLKWFSVLACFVICVPVLQAGERAPSVAVHLLEGRGVDLTEEQLVELTDYLGVRFGEAASCQILPWAEVHKKIQTKGYYVCMDRHCQIEAERLLDADYTLATSVLPMGKICIVTGSLYPRESPATTRTAMHRGNCDREALVASLEQVVDGLMKQGPLVVVPSVQPEEPTAKTVQPSVETHPGLPDDTESDSGEPREVVMMARPPMYLGFYAIYAPAPIMWWADYGGRRQADKLLDQFGPRFTLDMEVDDIWLMGLQVDGLGNRDYWMLEVIGRAGGQLVFGDSLQLYGLLGTGVSAWFRTPWGESYEGVVLSATLGARYMFMPTFGAQFELSGTAGFYGDEEFDEDFDLFRLELAFGLVMVL